MHQPDTEDGCTTIKLGEQPINHAYLYVMASTSTGLICPSDSSLAALTALYMANTSLPFTLIEGIP